jgi:hypothetical protein
VFIFLCFELRRFVSVAAASLASLLFPYLHTYLGIIYRPRVVSTTYLISPWISLLLHLIVVITPSSLFVHTRMGNYYLLLLFVVILYVLRSYKYWQPLSLGPILAACQLPTIDFVSQCRNLNTVLLHKDCRTQHLQDFKQSGLHDPAATAEAATLQREPLSSFQPSRDLKLRSRTNFSLRSLLLSTSTFLACSSKEYLLALF